MMIERNMNGIHRKEKRQDEWNGMAEDLFNFVGGTIIFLIYLIHSFCTHTQGELHQILLKFILSNRIRANDEKDCST